VAGSYEHGDVTNLRVPQNAENLLPSSELLSRDSVPRSLVFRFLVGWLVIWLAG
jgi:hypothetical protein